MMNKKDLKREYKEALRPMGVFQIRNMKNEKVFVGSSVNLAGIFNRHRFALNAGSFQSKTLQADWNKLGAENFSFEVLEEVDRKSTRLNSSHLARSRMPSSA